MKISILDDCSVATCTVLGVVVSPSMYAGRPSCAAAELTWRSCSRQGAGFRSRSPPSRRGTWQVGVGHTLRGELLGVYRYGSIGSVVAGCEKAFGMNVWMWPRTAAGGRDPRHRLGGDLARMQSTALLVCPTRPA
jgi:D-3-phosphoglycerate dehydrogenase / 2-oxoglutarate reductase